eukprot:scaffold148811_cov19-Tisochrysis_lutea.AAC.1
MAVVLTGSAPATESCVQAPHNVFPACAQETLPAAAKNGQQPAQHPPAVESGRLSQPQKAA